MLQYPVQVMIQLIQLDSVPPVLQGTKDDGFRAEVAEMLRRHKACAEHQFLECCDILLAGMMATRARTLKILRGQWKGK